MENWRKVWRDGVAPLLSQVSLDALRSALRRDDPTLIQNATTCPPAVEAFAEEEIEGACALCYCGWRGDGLGSVAEADAFFVRMCEGIDEALGEPAASRHFLDWFDQTPRAEMRRQLLPEVNRLLNHGRRRVALDRELRIHPAA